MLSELAAQFSARVSIPPLLTFRLGTCCKLLRQSKPQTLADIYGEPENFLEIEVKNPQTHGKEPSGQAYCPSCLGRNILLPFSLSLSLPLEHTRTHTSLVCALSPY